MSETLPEPHAESNRRVYYEPGVLRSYRAKTLMRIEALALLKHHEAFAGRRVLDLGIGTGRSSIYLAPIAGSYVGIDYSPVMVQQVREAYPELSVHRADIRDLSMFPDGSFDFVFGTNNVMDAVPHEGRLRAFAEVHRVLAPGGTLMFTSHNRDYRDAGAGPRLEWTRNPVSMLVNLRNWMVQLRNHARWRHARHVEGDAAFLNDGGHDFAVMHYYIAHEAQRRQSAQAGFRVVDVLDLEGRSVEPGTPERDSSYLMYVAVRVPVPVAGSS